jgi:hypothetical protein
LGLRAQTDASNETVVLHLVRVDDECAEPQACLLPVEERGDSTTVTAHPGDRFLIALENRLTEPRYGALVVLSGVSEVSQVVWPRPLQAGEFQVLPDTILIDDRIGTDVLIVLTAPHYFTPREVPTLGRDDFLRDGKWLVSEIVEQLERSKSELTVGRVYYHITLPRP